MTDTYYIEERSGVIGIGPFTNSPDLYPRRDTTINWRSARTWIHLIICILAIPLIIYSLYHLMFTIREFTYPNPVHWFIFLIVISPILMCLLGGLFALVVESAGFSDQVAKLLYVIAYLSIAITLVMFLIREGIIGILGLILLVIFLILFGFGFWRFTIISAIYLNEEGPLWFKPLLYGCLAAIPLLSTSSQCPIESKANTTVVYGCIPNEYFNGRRMENDYLSFILMTIIAIVSAIPYLLST